MKLLRGVFGNKIELRFETRYLDLLLSHPLPNQRVILVFSLFRIGLAQLAELGESDSNQSPMTEA